MDTIIGPGARFFTGKIRPLDSDPKEIARRHADMVKSAAQAGNLGRRLHLNGATDKEPV